METSDRIIEGLYLGGVMAALNERDLQSNKITHILSVDEKPLPDILTNKFSYKHIFALDLYDFELLSHFPDCFMFIDEGRDGGGAVLVHCQAGMSRSATIVIAYLMHKLKLTKEQAIKKVTAVRHFIRPNDGFLQQLQLFENMGCQLDKTHPEFRAFQLNKLAVRFKCGQFSGGVPESEIPAEVFVQPDLSAKGNDAYYKCQKCRTFLFHDGALSSHNVGEGDSAFDWRSKVPANKRPQGLSSSEKSVCQKSLFVDPLAWMKGKINTDQGKLHCPKCDAKIGSYIWYGEKCPCGAWVAPAFHISSGKVDKIPSQPVTPRMHIPATSDIAGSGSSPPSQPHQIGAVSAFPSLAGGSGRPAGNLSLPERTTAAAARLSSVHPVAAVQPRMAASTAQTTAMPSSANNTTVLVPNGPLEIQNEVAGDGSSAEQIRNPNNRDLESGITNIRMDVDSG
ncbi:unnamed protein product [Candidula unifasciata]|uniref:Protein-tyrosine-phosphatase n=1 Tax=Candidula unifasciata TaxID=100452 RepID=A0A8S3YP37_9EUPU|nr:unnamed protein product [Candidula unifasciata]